MTGNLINSAILYDRGANCHEVYVIDKCWGHMTQSVRLQHVKRAQCAHLSATSPDRQNDITFIVILRIFIRFWGMFLTDT